MNQDEVSKRPYRLWNAGAKKHLRFRCYKYLDNARISVLIRCKEAKVGTVIELYNIDTGKLLGQYVRRAHTIEFTKEKQDGIRKPKPARKARQAKVQKATASPHGKDAPSQSEESPRA